MVGGHDGDRLTNEEQRQVALDFIAERDSLSLMLLEETTLSSTETMFVFGPENTHGENGYRQISVDAKTGRAEERQ